MYRESGVQQNQQNLQKYLADNFRSNSLMREPNFTLSQIFRPEFQEWIETRKWIHENQPV